MLREAELFVMAEQMLVEVLGRVRPQDRDIVLPPMYAGADRPTPIWQAVEHYVRADAALPDVLAGRVPEQRPGPGPLDEPDDAPAAVARVAAAACAAVRSVVDEVQTGGTAGGLDVREHLLRTTVERSLLAHYVAAYLGSTACPLPEELARPLWELTEADAEHWRRLGYFRDPMPLPDHVSWRDRFLLTAGHEPHPLGHP